jgi:hypothetical protein
MPNPARREGKGARVWRKVPDENEMFVNTIEGKQGVKAKCCPSCGETKALGQFYYKGISKRVSETGQERVVDLHERICVVCWDAKKLDQKRRKKLAPANTITKFFDNE